VKSTFPWDIESRDVVERRERRYDLKKYYGQNLVIRKKRSLQR
jgi:hypothetical protein